MDLAALLSRLAAVAAPLRGWLTRWRGPIVGAALVLFLAGTVWSFLGLGLSLAQLDLTALALLTLGMGLVTLLYSAVSLSLLARTAGVRLGLIEAMRASARAQMAEALPLPGGAIVRAAALVGAGASAGQSAALVIGTALLWIALAAVAAGVTLLPMATAAGLTLIGGGGVVTLLASAHVAYLGGIANAAASIAVRLAGLALAALRLWLAFAVIKATMPLAGAFPYVLASIAGSASSLVPGGLGLSEALGMVMAAAIADSPEAAFLAVALNRLTLFLGTAAYAPVLEWLKRPAPIAGR